MNLKRTKKGFTIIELVIVIAVIGVLSAVLIPTFVNLTNKANEASDQSLVRNLNTALKMEEQTQGHQKSKTLQGAINDLEFQGFSLEQIVSKSGQDLLWDQEKNEFLLNKDDNLDGPQYWQIIDRLPEESKQRFSYYASQNMNAPSVSGFKYGFDMGANPYIQNITYSHTGDKQTVAIRANSDKCVVNVYAPSDDVLLYGFASKVNVADVAPTSLHIYGSVNQLALEKGNVEIESTGIVFDVVQLGSASSAPGTEATSTIVNKGYVSDATFSQHTSHTAVEVEAAKEVINNTEGSTKNVGGNYLIESLEQLETFRDAVNAGSDFSGKVVELKKNIALNDGWTPIGEGSRNYTVGTSGTADVHYFKGEFKGNDYTISNLNNKNWRPSNSRLGLDDNTVYTYCWGLFGLTGEGANIHNLKIENVDFDQNRYNARIDNKPVKGDSIGAIVGFSQNALTVKDCKVLSGTIIGQDAVGGLVGRSYALSGDDYNKQLVVSGCENNANVTAIGDKAAGIVGFANKNDININISECTNNGVITSNSICSGIIVFQSFSAISLVKNTNNGNLNAASLYTAGDNKDYVSVTYISVCLNAITSAVLPTVTAKDNVNNGTAYLGNEVKTTILVGAKYLPSSSGTELNTNTNLLQ